MIQNDVPRGINKAQSAVIVLEKRVVCTWFLRVDERHKHAGEIPERADLFPELFDDAFKP